MQSRRATTFSGVDRETTATTRNDHRLQISHAQLELAIQRSSLIYESAAAAGHAVVQPCSQPLQLLETHYSDGEFRRERGYSLIKLGQLHAPS